MASLSLPAGTAAFGLGPCLLSLLLALSSVSVAGPVPGSDPSTLIGVARNFDSMYCGSQQEDRDKAIALYEAALQAQPDKAQALEVLFRLAQLHGTNYQIPKGERPHYGQAMRLYQRIVSEYPPNEPLAVKSLICIGDILTVERRFDEALQWYGRALEVDVEPFLAERRAMERDPERRAEYEQVTNRIERIQFYQSSAVTAISYAARHIDPRLSEGILEGIVSRHRGDHIRDTVTSVLGKEGNAELFPLPAHLEDMTAYKEPAPASKSVVIDDVSVPSVPDAAPAAPVASQRQSSSYPGVVVAIVGAGLVTLAGVLVMRRKLGNQCEPEASLGKGD